MLSKIHKSDTEVDYTKTVDYNLGKSAITQVFTETMKEVVSFLESNSLKTINIPFKGMTLQITKDESRVIFTSGTSEDDESNDDIVGNNGSRLAVVDLTSEEVIMDQHVSNFNIFALALSNDDQFVFAAGEEGIVYKFLLADLSIVGKYAGHKNSICKIFITVNDEWIFTASLDGTVKLWDLKKKNTKGRTLLESNGGFYSLDLSTNNNYFCTGGQEKVLYLYENSFTDIENGKIINKFIHDAEIRSVKISQNCTFLALGDEIGIIKVLDFSTFSILYDLSMSDSIIDMDISITEEILITASMNTNIKIWFLSKNKDISYNGHKKCVRRCTLMHNDTKVVSISDDTTIKIWKVPEPEIETVLYSDNSIQILKFWVSLNDEIELLALQNSVINYMKLDQSGTLIESFQLASSTEAIFEVCPQQDVIVRAGLASEQDLQNFQAEKENRVYIIMIYTLRASNKPRGYLVKSAIKSLFLPISLKFLLVGEDFRFIIYDFLEFTVIHTVYLYGRTALDLIVNKRDTFMYVAGSEELYYFSINLNSEEVVKELNDKQYAEPLGKVKLFITENSQFLFILSSKFVEIIHCETFYSILNIPIYYSGFLQNINNTFFLYSEDHIDIYSLESFQKLSTIRRKYTINHAYVNNKFTTMYLCSANKITSSENPLNPSKMSLVGDYEYLERFQTYIDQVIARECEAPYYESCWLIEPIHVNILHVYAFFNMYDMLRDSIYDQDGDTIPFINSKQNFSPLTIATKMNYTDSIHAIIKPIIKRMKKSKDFIPQLLFQSIEEDLIDLNLSGYVSLHKLYKHLYKIDDSYFLPNYCPPFFSVPSIMSNYRSFFIIPEEFGFDLDEDYELGSSIVFKKTLARLYLNFGSQKSLEFMKSLEECSNTTVFETEIIKLILNQKWQIVKWIMYGQAFVYLGYLILLSLYVSDPESRTKTFLLAPFMVSLMLYLYEVIFMVIELKEYFMSFWNVMDSLRSWMMIIYCILVWTDEFEIKNDKNTREMYMLAVLIFVSWMRGITYFRINKSTRYLIKLLFKALAEIVPFMAIFFYSTIGFSVLFNVFKETNLGVFFPHLTDSYVIILGNWDNPEEIDFYSLILLFATILSPVVLLNLLIAVLTNTFVVVKDNEIVADSQEMISMIIEGETLMFWNRRENYKTYLHVMDNDTDIITEGQKLDMIIKRIREKVGYLNYEFTENETTITRFYEKLEMQSKETLESLSNFIYAH